jgi:hypothetical protein
VYRNSRRVSVAFGAAEYSENKITFRWKNVPGRGFARPNA